MKLELFLAGEVRGNDGGTNVSLDVFHHQVETGKVIDVGPHFMIVHQVGHVAHQHDVHSDSPHGAKTERTTDDAHVGVDAGEDYVLDTLLVEISADFGSRIRDQVIILDRYAFDLPFPHARGLAVLVFAAFVRLIDGPRSVFLRRQFVGPLPGNQSGPSDDLGIIVFPSFLTTGIILVKTHATAWRMHDFHALSPRDFKHLVETRSKLGDTSRSVGTPVFVPHVANNDGGLLWIPLLDSVRHDPRTRIQSGTDTLLQRNANGFDDFDFFFRRRD